MNAIEQEKTVFESISPQKEYEVIQKITNFFFKNCPIISDLLSCLFIQWVYLPYIFSFKNC